MVTIIVNKDWSGSIKWNDGIVDEFENISGDARKLFGIIGNQPQFVATFKSEEEDHFFVASGHTHTLHYQ